MNNHLEKSIYRQNEEALERILSDTLSVNDHIAYFHDELLPDMYDHNFYYVGKELTKDDLDAIERLSIKENKSHVKFVSDNPLSLLVNNREYERSCIMAMAKKNGAGLQIKNAELEFRKLSKENIENDLMQLELENYGEEYGLDFTKRKMNRYFSEVKNGRGLDFIAAFIDNKIVGSCFIFDDGECVAIDGLLVSPPFRHQKIATSIIAFIYDLFKKPIYLHADMDDTPKLLYEKLGFKVEYKRYEYLRKLK